MFKKLTLMAVLFGSVSLTAMESEATTDKDKPVFASAAQAPVAPSTAAGEDASPAAATAVTPAASGNVIHVRLRRLNCCDIFRVIYDWALGRQPTQGTISIEEDPESTAEPTSAASSDDYAERLLASLRGGVKLQQPAKVDSLSRESAIFVAGKTRELTPFFIGAKYPQLEGQTLTTVGNLKTLVSIDRAGSRDALSEFAICTRKSFIVTQKCPDHGFHAQIHYEFTRLSLQTLLSELSSDNKILYPVLSSYFSDQEADKAPTALAPVPEEEGTDDEERDTNDTGASVEQTPAPKAPTDDLELASAPVDASTAAGVSQVEATEPANAIATSDAETGSVQVAEAPSDTTTSAEIPAETIAPTDVKPSGDDAAPTPAEAEGGDIQ